MNETSDFATMGVQPNSAHQLFAAILFQDTPIFADRRKRQISNRWMLPNLLYPVYRSARISAFMSTGEYQDKQTMFLVSRAGKIHSIKIRGNLGNGHDYLFMNGRYSGRPAH